MSRLLPKRPRASGALARSARAGAQRNSFVLSVRVPEVPKSAMPLAMTARTPLGLATKDGQQPVAAGEKVSLDGAELLRFDAEEQVPPAPPPPTGRHLLLGVAGGLSETRDGVLGPVPPATGEHGASTPSCADHFSHARPPLRMVGEAGKL